MTNNNNTIKTSVNKVSMTTIIEKSFTATTEKGFEIMITVYRKIINVGTSPFQSPIYFGVSFKGQEFGHNDMDKVALKDAISVINKWGGKL
jgi:hypothetical protein